MARKITLWLLVICTCLSASVAVACSGGKKPTPSQTPSVAPSVSVSTTPTVKPTAKPTIDTTKMTYRVYVYTQGGAPLAGVGVEVRRGDNTVALENTDDEGLATFSLYYDEYTVILSGAPAGYDTTQTYPLDSEELICRLSSAVISGSAPSDLSYEVGDVMYDFTVTTSDKLSYTLSEELKTHDAVMINFWYTTCYWCLEEFPFMVQAFNSTIEGTEELYSDRVSLICVTYEDNATISAFKQKYLQEFDLTSFDMAKDLTLISQFGINAFPTSIIIDRYGVVVKKEESALLSVKDFTSLLDRYIGDDYTPSEDEEEEDQGPVYPEEEMPSSGDMNAALSPTYNFTYAAEAGDAFSWPFLLKEENGSKYAYASNSYVTGSYAIMYVTAEMQKDQIFTFDYYCESEHDADILFLLADRQIIQEISGTFNGWQTMYLYTALEAGTYEFVFVYMKDESTDLGEDTVKLRNIRLENVTDIEEPFYVKRAAVWNFNADEGKYTSNAQVALNPETGFYHVVREDGSFGPLLMTDFMQGTNWSDISVFYYSYYFNAFAPDYYGGMDMNPRIEHYSQLCNNTPFSLVPVNEELYTLLHHIVRMDLSGSFVVVDEYDETSNEWLELCYYFDAYNTVEMPNPTIGLDNENAYTLKLDDPETEIKETNVATFDSILIPRGKRFKFVPEVSGVYRATGLSEYETLCWLFLPDGTMPAESDFTERLPYDNGERKNFSLVMYLEAGETYYLAVGFYDIYQMGDLPFYVEYVGEEYEVFRFASPGYFTYDENDPDMTILSGGIDLALDEDGYYREKKADGTLGSYLYADVTNPTSIFDYSLIYLATTNAFNFGLDEENNPVLDEYGNPIEDDKTAAFRAYAMLNQIKKGDTLPDGRIAGDEVVGCVLVDETLANILYQLTSKYTFPGVENSWAKLCCYYQYYGPTPAAE